MPQTDILNRCKGFDPALGDTMNPNFGFTRKRPITRGLKKAVGGSPYTRDTSNTGHSFTLSWINRTWACVQRLKWYYEQYEDGFFTIIDHDGGGRHFVGRFTTEVNPVETANGKWSVELVTFEEIPKVPMMQYPNDWAHDSIRLAVCNDFGDQKLCPTTGTWALNPRTLGNVHYTTLDDAGTLGDSATYEYKGYGFRLWLLKGPEFGLVNVLLDGVQIATNLDLYNAADVGPQMVFMNEAVPLDFHRVQVVATGNKNGAATAAGLSWAFLDVMR